MASSRWRFAWPCTWVPVDPPPPPPPPPVESPPVGPPPGEPPPIEDGGVIVTDSDDEPASFPTAVTTKKRGRAAESGKLTKPSALPPANANRQILPIKKPAYVTPIRKAHPQRPFTTMLERGSFSIDVMLSILPEILTKALAFDIYCRRCNIMDGDVGLRGAEPYSFNEAMADYFAYAERMIREGSSRYVLLTGGEVKKWWEAGFCPVDKRSYGCPVKTGKRWIRNTSIPCPH